MKNFEDLLTETTKLMLNGTITKKVGDEILSLLYNNSFNINNEAKSKLEYIIGSSIVRDFPNVEPTLLWTGAVIDFFCIVELYNEN